MTEEQARAELYTIVGVGRRKHADILLDNLLEARTKKIAMHMVEGGEALEDEGECDMAELLYAAAAEIRTRNWSKEQGENEQ